MKKPIRNFLFYLFTFWIFSDFLHVFSYHGPEHLIQAALTLTLLNLFIRPIINLLFLPINLITLGFLSWIPSLLTLYLTTFLTPNFTLNQLTLPAFSILRLHFPRLHFGWFSSLLVIFFLFKFTHRLLRKFM